MILTKQSFISGKTHSMELDISEDELSMYHSGKLGLIQDAFPNLTPDEREFIMTGITPEEWNSAFPEK